jgi:hypothetical protein
MDELIAIKDRAWEKFCTLPGVHAVGIGRKVTAGVRTDETVLTVFVTKKLPLEELSDAAAVPPVFEGVCTDVLERPMPTTLQAVPVTVVSSAIVDGMSFSFSGPPGAVPPGIRIVISLKLQTNSGRDEFLVKHMDSDGQMTLATMLNFFVMFYFFYHPNLVGTVFSITAPDPATQQLHASCYVLATDIGAYGGEFMRGGVRIQGGSKDAGGTLGGLASLAPTPEFPQGRIVGVTCSHVVRNFVADKALLEVKSQGNTAIALATLPSVPAIPAHNVIYVIFTREVVPPPGFAEIPTFLEASTFYTTKDNESLASIANGLADAIEHAGVAGVTARVTSASATNALIAVNGFSAATNKIECRVHGPLQFPGTSSLKGSVEKLASGDHVVNFSGSVDSDDAAVFVDIDGAGFAATFGVFQKPRKGQKLEDLAQAVSTAINLWPSAQRGPVSATAVGTKVTIASAKDVRYWIERDIRVGQPVGFFGTGDPRCCNFKMGRVIAARLDVDVALIQLDAGMKFKYHIQEVNAIAGTEVPALGLAVQKRGAFTGLTEGMVSAVATSGFIGGSSLSRIYRNVAVIESTILETPETHRAFAQPGDSGSLVLTTGPGLPKVVGVMFGGQSNASALMTPVDDIVTGFSDLGLTFDPGPGVDLSAVHTVPGSAFQAIDAPAPVPFHAFGMHLREAENDFATTPVGREYTEFFRRNIPEALELVNHNRRVATVWHRSGGPELLNAALRALRFDDEPLPREINGRPLAECIARLKKILLRYGSPGFASDIARMAARSTDFAGLTYRQLLESLRAGAPG